MKNKFLVLSRTLLVLLISFSFLTTGNAEGDKSNKGKSKANKSLLKEKDAYRMNINNVDLPLNRLGVLADVAIGGETAGGKINTKVFLYSGGFFLSGVTDGRMWANAVASASRIQDYVPGTVASGRNDPRAQLYIIRQTDGDFSASWTEWKDAVDLGAYYYDGDGDGVYNPVDKNGNGKWDSDEDRPDLLGDETVWCVYNDGTDPALRRFNDVDPQGIEIRQTVFAFNSKGVVGNMIFIRYSIVNTGKVANVIDSVYLGVWADPDLGDAYDDLVGCDAPQSFSGYPKADTAGLDAGYVYNNGDDGVFGNNPPSFLIDFFQGPITYIPGVTFTDVNGNGVYDEGVDTPIDTAHNVQGQVRRVAKIPGAKNVGLSSFVHYMQSHATLGDPNTRQEARNYMLGYDKLGNPLDPATWAFGTVLGGVNPTGIDNRFFYSGDPVTSTGWINSLETDQRQMSNTGPFQLLKDQPVDIFVAYVVGRGTNALNSVSLTKNYSKIAQLLFDSNFPSPPPPPPVKVEVNTGADFIDLTWATNEQVSYQAIDTVLDIDRRFQGYYVTAYRTNAKLTNIAGLETSKEIATYDLKDSINNYYTLVGNGGLDLVRTEAPAENKLDSAVYADPVKGRIKLRLKKDPFTDGPFIKGKEYYYTVTTYTLNHQVIFHKDSLNHFPKSVGAGRLGDYADSTGGGLEEYETAIVPVTFGKDLFAPANETGSANMAAGFSNGAVKYVVVNNENLTGDNYSIEFKNKKNPTNYGAYWSLKNTTKNVVLIDSSDAFDFDTTKYAGIVYEGFVPKVKPVSPALGELTDMTYTSTKPRWYTNFTAVTGTGAYYVGSDIPGSTTIPVPKNFASPKTTKQTTADRLRKVELKFGAPNAGKAYRYLNGFIGSGLTAPLGIYRYAAGVAATDTVGKGEIGQLGVGFVDVPFTAWVVDSRYNEERQLAVGFIEARKSYGGTPDGIWDPDTSLNRSSEVIVIFDSDYKADGSHLEYTGGIFTDSTVWADINRGWNPPSGITVDTNIAKSQLFNALYVVGFQRLNKTDFFTPGDVFTIPVAAYPYTEADKFTFSTKYKGALSEAEKKDLFNKVNVFPNPLFAYNPATSFNNGNSDEPFITFSNLPEEVTVKVYTLSGMLIRTMTTADKSSPTSPFLRWDLNNESGLRIASGVYLAIVSSPGYGEKILKFSVIMPQKQIQRF
jgi:hypothetical protein